MATFMIPKRPINMIAKMDIATSERETSAFIQPVQEKRSQRLKRWRKLTVRFIAARTAGS
jgi:hypothetical protein